MLNPLGIPTVDKAPSQTRQQIQPLVGLAQQQTTPIGADCSTVKTGHNFPPGTVFKSEAGLVTLRHSESRSPLSRKQLRLQMFMPERTALAYPSREKWRLGLRPSEVERYVFTPGQACSYMTGQMRMLAIRDKAKRALGQKF